MFTMEISHTLEATHVEFFSDEDEPEVDLGNITNSYTVLTTPNTRIHKDHPIENVIGDVKSSVQTRRMTKPTSKQGFLRELLQFKLQQVWILVDLPIGKRAIRTKWVFRNKKDERGIVIRNKVRLVAQGHRQEEVIDYEEVFAPMARIKVIRLFLAYASFMGFLVYQMDVKSAFLYGTIEEEVYVTQPPGFKDPDHPDKVYKVVKALYGLQQAPRACYTNKDLCTGFEKLMKDNQDKYVAEILKKFNYTDVKSASTPVDFEKPLVKDGYVDDVDVHLYRSMIGSLMYLTASSLDIMFAVCACARFQVTPKTSHLLAVKRIFRNLKGKPTLGLWYSRDSPFELVAYTNSDYAGATQDRKSTTGGCQFLGNRLISWQCKKQTMVATSTTEAEYVVAASCCGQVLWIQNQLLDYGYNFMNTVININNNNLLTKGFDAGRHVKRGRDTKIPQSSGPLVKVGDEAVHKELGDRMERAATTTSSLEAEQDSDSLCINCQSYYLHILHSTVLGNGKGKHCQWGTSVTRATLNGSSPYGIGSGSGPRCQDTILGDVDAQTRFETASKQSNDPPLSRSYTIGSGEDSMKLLELMELSTKLSKMLHKNRKSDLFWATAKANIVNGERQLQALIDKKKVIITESSIRSDLYLEDAGVDDTQGRSDNEGMFDTNDLHGDEVNVDMPVGEKQEQSVKEREVYTSVEDSDAPTTIEEITLAQTLIQIKAAKPKVVTTAATTTITTRPKARGVVVQEPNEFRTLQESQPSMIKDKGKAIMIEPEVPLKRKDQVALDEDLARNLQA
ncbi:putative ribonuclease H-like domain-containing protein [Tanacetum coccineum]